MIKLLLSGLLAVLMMAGCGWDGTPTRHNDFVPLTSIKIVAAVPAIEATHTIAPLTSTKLTVIGEYSGAFTRDITDQATWSSGSPGVANFISNTSPNLNRVSAVSAGTATLTASVGSVSATYALTVSNAAISSITVSPSAPSVPMGLTTQYTAAGTFSDTTVQDLTFDAAWATDASGFASVSNDPASKGLAKGLATGTAAITATFDGLPGAAQMNVTPAILQSITVTPANSSISGTSKTHQFTATGAYSDGTTNAITSTVTWASSLTNIATIATGGLATTVAVGTTSISATLGGLSGKTNLAVTALALNSNGLQMTPESPVLGVGTTQQMTVTATFIDNSTQNVTASCIWGSNAPVVATVNTAGLVAGDSSGIASITATCLGQTVATVVTVN